MDYFLTEVTIPLLTATYNKLVDPCMGNLRTLRENYTHSYDNKCLVQKLDGTAKHLECHLPKELVLQTFGYLGSSAHRHLLHKQYPGSGALPCFLCHTPYISQVDLVTSTFSEVMTLLIGIIILLLVLYVTYRLGTWVNAVFLV